MKHPLILTLAFVFLATVAQATAIKVFTRGGVEGLAEQFKNSKDSYTFVSLSAGELKKPAFVKYAPTIIPRSIHAERKDHNVEIGFIVSDKGAVVATCIVSSNCKVLEDAVKDMLVASKFSPASLDGKPLYFYVTMPFSYKYVDPSEFGK